MTALVTPWLDTAQVMAYSGFGYQFVLRAMRSGDLKAHQPMVHAPWRAERYEVDEWMRRMGPVPQGPRRLTQMGPRR